MGSGFPWWGSLGIPPHPHPYLEWGPWACPARGYRYLQAKAIALFDLSCLYLSYMQRVRNMAMIKTLRIPVKGELELEMDVYGPMDGRQMGMGQP